MADQHSRDWTSKLSREQLCAELIKCHEERDRLRATCKGDQSADVTQHNGLANSDVQTEYAQMAAKLRQERDAAREELALLEREMDELHDNFKEEENEQFEQLKQELDSAIKNCKILQIKLNKSERQYNQLEQVKLMLEKQLEDQMIQKTAPSASATPPSLSGVYGNKLNRLNKNNSNDSCDNPNNNNSQSANFIQLGSQCVKLATHEYDQLLRDLNDTIEREKDLAEQLKYSQEEAQVKSDRLQQVESENESLLANIQKLTQSNAHLRSQQMSSQRSSSQTRSSNANSNSNDNNLLIIEQNEQLKLALDLSQSECKQLKLKCQNLGDLIEQKEQQLRDAELRRSNLEGDLTRVRSLRRSSAIDHADQSQQAQNGNNKNNNNSNAIIELEDQVSRLELECRQLRSKLVHSERENKQLKQNASKSAAQTTNQKIDQQLIQLREANRQLSEQLRNNNNKNQSELSSKNKSISASSNAVAAATANQEASDELLAKMRAQLDSTESELAKAKSRLVELDLELSRTRRAHKGLLESLEERAGNALANKFQGKDTTQLRDSMSRQELRDNIRELESQMGELKSLLGASAHLLKQNQHHQQQEVNIKSKQSELDDDEEDTEKVLELEREANAKLRSRLNELERLRVRQERELSMLERERVKMQEELDRSRNLNTELRNELDESSRREQQVKSRQRDLQLALDKLRKELGTQQQKQASSLQVKATAAASANSSDPNVLSKDLSELKVKNNFLMRELELAREDYQRQLEEERKQRDQQIKRAVELAQLEIREADLAASGKLRDEISELKGKLASNQRLVTRAQEDTELERDKLRGAEREWRRERSQWQQKVEQLDSQLTIERRASGFKLKEFESSLRDKDRELLTFQDKCLQLERDLSRVQAKFSQYQEQCENKLAQLSAELDAKKRDIQTMLQEARNREEHNYENMKRLSSEKACLSEALESIKCSLDEKMGELKSARELLVLRQDQNYRERQANQEKLDELSRRLVRVSEWESQCKLLQNQCQIHERQGESYKRELLTLKEDKQRLKTRCDELERRCQLFEKQEFMAKTSALSKTNFSPISNSKMPISSQNNKTTSSKLFSSQNNRAANNDHAADLAPAAASESEMIERLLAKVNDQRNLMSIIKQQMAELQMELKQVKLLHSCEKSKLQCQINELTSRLNESEEKLLVELSLNNVAPQTLEAGKRKVELKWADERKSANELISQQQGENDKLTRDLKKLSQAHDLLRLHCKQIESHNAKLSRKLIEYQQKDQQQQQHPLQGNEISSESIARLESDNVRLRNLLRNQVQPLVETVSRMMNTLEQPSASSAPTPTSNSGDSQQKSTQSSTLRPLRTTMINYHSRESSVDESDSCSQSYNPSLALSQLPRADQIQIKTARPAHKMNATYQQSRLSRFLPSSNTNKPTMESQDGNNNDNNNNGDSSAKRAPTTKIVRKVRLKSASLGLTLAERRHLKTRLEQLSSELLDLESCKKTISTSSTNMNTSNAHKPSTSMSPKYKFNFDSDLESSSEAPYKPPVIPKLRFYQSDQQHSLDDKSNSNHQLEADYESESSIRSDYSTASAAPAYKGIARKSTFGDHRLSTAGAESDSALTTTSGAGHHTGSSSTDQLSGRSKVLTKTKPSRGLKGRLTNTIRSLSRSLVGLTSDSESEEQQQLNKDKKRVEKGKSNKHNLLYGYEQTRVGNASANSNDIREVRL